jgi:hypothetical protein
VGDDSSLQLTFDLLGSKEEDIGMKSSLTQGWR